MADFLVAGGADGRVVVPDNPVVCPPLLHPLADLLHHPEELLGLQGSLATTQDSAELQRQNEEQRGGAGQDRVGFPHGSPAHQDR